MDPASLGKLIVRHDPTADLLIKALISSGYLIHNHDGHEPLLSSSGFLAMQLSP
jgi:hypothetical protein